MDQNFIKIFLTLNIFQIQPTHFYDSRFSGKYDNEMWVSNLISKKTKLEFGKTSMSILFEIKNHPYTTIFSLFDVGVGIHENYTSQFFEFRRN